ncbi:hypothetical protein C8J57DRAFT_1707348 [Mycena rebaudengoi]|nr:hypothetical protein C8J57DRAFT_1707348 [Mycena rebaudengoi]
MPDLDNGGSESSPVHPDGFNVALDRYPRFYEPLERFPAKYGMKRRSGENIDIASLAGLYRWVFELNEEIGVKDNHLDSYNPASKRYYPNTGYLELFFDESKDEKPSAQTLRGKLVWRQPHGCVTSGSFEGAKPLRIGGAILWETGNWNWDEESDQEYYDDAGHEIAVSEVLDDNGHPFIIVTMWSNKDGCHAVLSGNIYAKKHSGKDVDMEWLTETEQARLNMNLSDQELVRKAKAEKGKKRDGEDQKLKLEVKYVEHPKLTNKRNGDGFTPQPVKKQKRG